MNRLIRYNAGPIRLSNYLQQAAKAEEIMQMRVQRLRDEGYTVVGDCILMEEKKCTKQS